MRFLDTDRWNEIWQTIARNKKRSIMTALGVFWGIFMLVVMLGDRKSTRLNSSHKVQSRMPSSA